VNTSHAAQPTAFPCSTCTVPITNAATANLEFVMSDDWTSMLTARLTHKAHRPDRDWAWTSGACLRGGLGFQRSQTIDTLLRRGGSDGGWVVRFAMAHSDEPSASFCNVALFDTRGRV
jgi:hypothetical protein